MFENKNTDEKTGLRVNSSNMEYYATVKGSYDEVLSIIKKAENDGEIWIEFEVWSSEAKKYNISSYRISEISTINKMST